MKMSDAFDLPLQTAVNELAIIDRKDCVVGWADAFSGEPARDCFVEAINSHDRMTDEIADLKVINGGIKSKSLHRKMHIELLNDEIAELREALESLCEPAFKYSDFVRNAPSLAEFSEKIKRDVKKAHNLLNK